MVLEDCRPSVVEAARAGPGCWDEAKQGRDGRLISYGHLTRRETLKAATAGRASQEQCAVVYAWDMENEQTLRIYSIAQDVCDKAQLEVLMHF